MAPVFLEHLKGAFEVWTKGQGDPTSMSTMIGPVADTAQKHAVTKYIEIGKGEGKIAIGGSNNGGFVAPTIFTDAAEDSQINREEVCTPAC